MYKRIDYSKYKIIKDIYGDEYYLTDSRYSKEYDLTVLFGRRVITTLASFSVIRTQELKKFILDTLGQSLKFMKPVLSRGSISNLRREFQANPYSTYRQWIKHGCKPEFVTFPDARENPQTIFDYAGVEHVLYSARKTSGNVIIYTGKTPGPGKKSGRAIIITPELAQVIFNLDMTRAEKMKKLGIEKAVYHSIANKKLKHSVYKMKFNYMVNNAHRFLSGSAEKLYPEFKNDGWCDKTTINLLQYKVAFIRNRMPGQKYEDPKFIQLLTDAAENPCEENRKKYLEYKSRINKGKNIGNLIDTYNILKQSGIWRKYEQLIEHDAERVQLDYVTSEREYIKDIRGKTYHVTDIKKDRIFGRIFFGRTWGVLNKRAVVIVTDELAAKIKQSLGKSHDYFSSSILTTDQITEVRCFVLSGLYSTLNDWINDKNRPVMMVFKNKNNPHYITDYFGAKWVLYKAEDIQGYFLLQGIESSRKNEKRIGLKPILTPQIAEVIVKHRYDPVKIYRILPIKNRTINYFRRALGFNRRKSDLVDRYAENYKLITESGFEKAHKELPFIKKTTVYSLYLYSRQIKKLRASSKARDREILDKFEHYYKHGDDKTRIELDKELVVDRARKMRFAYAVLKKAKKI